MGIKHVELGGEGTGILTVTTNSNWFYGKGIYQYAIEADQITGLEVPVYTSFAEDEKQDDLIMPFIDQLEYSKLNLNFPWINR